MYRGRPPPAFVGRGLPPPKPYLAAGYRDDRNRPRLPYHPGYKDHGHPDSYRRSPPHRRQPSPGAGSQRGGGHWAGGPPKESSPSPCRPIPLDHNLVITVGNELTGSSGLTSSCHHDRDHPPGPEYEQSWSRGQSRDHSPDQSRGRSQTKSQGRSQSRGRSPDRSRGRSRDCSPDRSRARSRGWSKSRARSKSRPRSRSRTRSQSRGRSRGQSHGQSYSKGVSHSRSKSWQRRHSRSRNVGSSSSSDDDSDKKNRKEFKELQMARCRKELQEMMSLPTKSILKKRNDSEDSPSLRSSDLPRCLDGANKSRVVDQLLLAVRGLEPHMVASMLSELRSDPQMAQHAGLDTEIKEILNLLGGRVAGAGAQEKAADDIDDEEKFLYGDSEEPKPLPASDPVRLHGLDLYGDVTEETLYGDYPSQTYELPPALPHLQAPPATREMDVRFTSRPTINPDQNITVQVSNPACPPGTEPLQESERQALEEYEKIQDLLKTIGLDLGVGEISKMVARTKERLHGNKPSPRMPTCSRRYSSSSSDGSRRHRRQSHSSSSSSSRSRSSGRGGGWSSDDGRRKNSAPPRSHRDAKEAKGITAQPLQNYPKSSPLPPHPGSPIPTYPPSQVHSMMPPSYPSPGYGQYGNYLPYMHQQWPPMYPPPSMSLPPDGGPEQFPPALNYERPYNPAAPEPGATGVLKSCIQDSEMGKVSSHDRRVSEEQNNESQKQKVLGEREKLRQEREIRMKKKEYLMKELERLRKQQGELLRKKRREKGGHKDPLLQEISHLQEEVMAQISNLRKEHEAAEKKCTEIDKVALILGLSPSDRPCRTSKPSDNHEDEPLQPPPPEKRRREPERSPEGSVIKASAVPPVSAPALAPAPPPDPFEYYDAGNHWCKNCNVTSGSMFDFFTHLHSKTHRKTLDPYDRPWASTPTKIIKTSPAEEKLTKPAKGSEFLLPVRGFFCLLCKQFYGDAICAEEHVTTHPHNEKYKKQMYENPLYEQRRNLDRQAGLVSETSGKKRKHEDDEKGNKDKEEKSKHKKEKRDKENKTEEDDADQKEEKSKVKKEEKQRTSKKEEESKDARSLEEEWPSHGQKDEDEKSKNSKKQDKYRHSREEEERGKCSRRDEDDRYKYSRVEEHQSRYRRDEHDRHDEQPKYGLREEEDKNKSSKYSVFIPTYDRERDEGKPKADKEAVKKLEPAKPAGKPEVSKPEPPPKPYDPPKILCGPSPAMRAKLRKQSLETSKPASTATTSSFGKFTWKKREDILAKEAEKVAAEFIKDDEAAANQNPVSVEDSFAKSMAVAKEIAEKLSGQQSTPSPPVSNRGRIRPNLPAPTAVLRKTTTTSKPAPLNTLLSIRPQSVSSQLPPAKEAQAFPGPLTNTLNAQSSPLESKLQTPVGRPDPSEARPTPPVSNSAPPEIKPATRVYNSAPSEVKPATPTMIRIVSDVAAPGVPESEQTHTVFVKPPPFMTMSTGPQKSAKLRSNLAAAKAQDLFGIFYGSISQPGTSSITKPATDARGSTTNKSQPPSLETQKPQAQRQPLTHSEPPTVVCTSPLMNSVHTPSSQTQPQSDLHIASVWSVLQFIPPPTREVAASKTPTETAQTILNPPAQSEAQILPQNHSPTPESESRNVPQAEPASLEPTPETLSQPNLTPQNQTQQPAKPQPDQDTQTPSHPEIPPDTVSLAEPQASPKTRGKTTPAKRNPPAPRPVRQTRSQTWQQQQSQSESEPELTSADSDSAGSDPKGLDMSDLGSALYPDEEAPGKGDPQMMGLIPETLASPPT